MTRKIKVKAGASHGRVMISGSLGDPYGLKALEHRQMTVKDFVRQFFPDADDTFVGRVLFRHTTFPFSSREALEQEMARLVREVRERDHWQACHENQAGEGIDVSVEGG